MRRVLLYAALVGGCGAAISCAPTVDGVAERQRAIDTDDGLQIAAALGALPGVVSAQATVRRIVEDPLQPHASTQRPSPTQRPSSSSPPGSAALLIVIDDHADRAQTLATARQLVRGVAPDVSDPQIVVAQSDPRPALAHVGPFEVVASSRRPLILTLAVALAAIAALALALARYARRGSSAQ